MPRMRPRGVSFEYFVLHFASAFENNGLGYLKSHPIKYFLEDAGVIRRPEHCEALGRVVGSGVWAWQSTILSAESRKGGMKRW